MILSVFRRHQSIFILRLVGKSIDAEVVRVLRNTMLFEQILYIEDIKAHVTDLAQKLLLKVNEEVWLLLDLRDSALHSILIP